jgi:hypothetical protein
MLLNDSSADPEAKTGSLCGLSGKKWFEDVCCISIVDPAAGVRDGDMHSGTSSVSARRGRNPHTQSSALRHGLNRIADEVHEDLFQLYGETLHMPLCAVLLFDRDPAHL